MTGLKAYLPAFWSLPSLFLTEAAAAGSIGLINSVGNLGGFVGPTVMGIVKDYTGSYRGGLWFLALLGGRLGVNHHQPRDRRPPRGCAQTRRVRPPGRGPARTGRYRRDSSRLPARWWDAAPAPVFTESA